MSLRDEMEEGINAIFPLLPQNQSLAMGILMGLLKDQIRQSPTAEQPGLVEICIHHLRRDMGAKAQA